MYNISLETMCPTQVSTINQQKQTIKKTSIPTGVDKVELNTDPLTEKPARMLVDLLKSALNGEKCDSKELANATAEDWRNMIKMADYSSITAIASDGIGEVGVESIPRDTVFKIAQSQIEAESVHRSQEMNLKMIQRVLNHYGIETVQLKGLGLSMLYPNPTHRIGCDVDIYTRLKDTTTESRSNSGDIVDKIMLRAGIKVEDYDKPKAKHSEFVYNGTNFENHKFFVNKEKLSQAKMLDELLHKTLNPQETVLPKGTKILTPSKEFNTIFLAQHALQHYIWGGLNLHHLADWSMFIRENGLKLPEETKGTKFEEFTHALTNLSNRFLGTNIPVPENKEYENELLSKMLHPEKHSPSPELSKLEILFFKVKRNIKTSQKAKEFGGGNIAKIFFETVLEKIHDIPALFRPL